MLSIARIISNYVIEILTDIQGNKILQDILRYTYWFLLVKCLEASLRYSSTVSIAIFSPRGKNGHSTSDRD